MPTRTRTTRTFTISLPPQLAEEVERVAAAEHRTISELMRESFRTYKVERARAAFERLQALAEKTDTSGYGPGDVERLVDEVRAEQWKHRQQ